MQFTNDNINKDLTEIGRMLREELWLLGVFIFIFEIFFPIDVFVFITITLGLLCIFRDVQIDTQVVVVWTGVVAFMSCVGTMVIGGVPFLLWGWRKSWGRMVQLWKQNIKISFMSVEDIPFKRKVNICLIWFYIMVRLLCIVVYVMPKFDIIALALRDELLPEIKFFRMFPHIPHMSPSCAIAIFLIETVLFYFAVHVPFLHKTKMDSVEKKA